MKLQGQIVDIPNKRIFKGEITVVDGKIATIEAKDHDIEHYILPGFVDAHIHIESSMLVPSEFARLAVTHGTVATVSDPHEIANVLGVAGVEFMIDNGKKTPLNLILERPLVFPLQALNRQELLSILRPLNGYLKIPTSSTWPK